MDALLPDSILTNYLAAEAGDLLDDAPAMEALDFVRATGYTESQILAAIKYRSRCVICGCITEAARQLRTQTRCPQCSAHDRAHRAQLGGA